MGLGWGFLHPLDDEASRDHPNETSHRVECQHDRAVGFVHLHDNGESHREQGVGHEKNQQHDGADELAGPGVHVAWPLLLGMLTVGRDTHQRRIRRIDRLVVRCVPKRNDFAQRPLMPTIVERSTRYDASTTSKVPVSDQVLQAWLIGVAALVFAIIMVGGATRLTDSGLSITEWRPILGALPPLSMADWQEAFVKYQAIPQYESVNKGMTLDAFKVIFWWEWGHRLLGRVIGLACVVPLAFLWLSGRLRADYAPWLAGLVALVGLQGGVGWYMVQSGLVGRIDVSQYRLALHLSIAFVILGYLVWLILSLASQRRLPVLQTLGAGRRWAAYGLAVLVFSQVAIGGFVAGLKAGRAYNTWPLMDGQIIPDGLARLSPWWVNFTENITTVQFNHRLTAYVLVAFAIWHAVRIVRQADDERVRWSAIGVAIGVVAQMALGIWTVLAAVPIGLGVAHQGFAAVVFALAVWHAHAVYVSAEAGAQAVRLTRS